MGWYRAVTHLAAGGGHGVGTRNQVLSRLIAASVVNSVPKIVSAASCISPYRPYRGRDCGRSPVLWRRLKASSASSADFAPLEAIDLIADLFRLRTMFADDALRQNP